MKNLIESRLARGWRILFLGYGGVVNVGLDLGIPPADCLEWERGHSGQALAIAATVASDRQYKINETDRRAARRVTFYARL